MATVGAVSTGLPTVGLPGVGLSDLTFLAAGAAGIVFLAVGESIGAGRSFATRHGYELDPDQEMIGLGAANISAGLFGGFSVDASLSQTATGETAGVRTQLSSLITVCARAGHGRGPGTALLDAAAGRAGCDCDRRRS